MKNILITPFAFGKTDDAPLKKLDSLGFKYMLKKTENPYTKEEMIDLIGDFDGVILGTDPFDQDVINAAKRLQVVSRFGVGADNVDVNLLKERGIAFYRTIGVNADAVADSAMGLILAVSKRIVPIDNDLKAGKWYEPETFEINNKTLGLIGFGHVGAKVAKRASGFDMKILAYDPCRNEELARSVNAVYVDTVEQILRKSDIISLHLPLLPETYHFIGSKEIAMMKKNAVLINTARGGIVDEEALANALEEERILGAGLDVFENEPLEKESRLLQLRNVVLSPHVAADTHETLGKVGLAATENLIEGFKLYPN